MMAVKGPLSSMAPRPQSAPSLYEIPHYRVGSKMLLFKKSELDEWMLQFRKGGDAELGQLVDETLAKVI